jgi:predicted RNA binding protein with dsRBD fold (UPF0201 family)
MAEITVTIETEINPTESEDKVKQAIQNIFDNIPTHTETSGKTTTLQAQSTGRDTLRKLYYLLRRERIRDAAKRVFLSGLSGNIIIFFLNKQVAYVGHISFSEETSESPLGPIKVTITTDNPREIINWLTSKIQKE